MRHRATAGRLSRLGCGGPGHSVGDGARPGAPRWRPEVVRRPADGGCTVINTEPGADPTQAVTVAAPVGHGPEDPPTQVLETVVREHDQGPPTVTIPKAGARESAARVLRRATGHHLPTIFTWIRNIGAIILLFVAWQLWGTAIAEHHAQATLRTQFDALVHSHPPTAVGGQALIPITTHVSNPPEGTVVAELSIPAIDLNQFVVSGTATDDLAKGPGHYIGSAAPGQAGNVAIAGHRTTHGAPFNRLAELEAGRPDHPHQHQRPALHLRGGRDTVPRVAVGRLWCSTISATTASPSRPATPSSQPPSGSSWWASS